MPPFSQGQPAMQQDKILEQVAEYGMNGPQRKEARDLAIDAINKGADPKGLVHVLFYPNDYEPGEDSIQGLSTPLPADSSLDGYTSSYYTLEQLAK